MEIREPRIRPMHIDNYIIGHQRTQNKIHIYKEEKQKAKEKAKDIPI